LVYPIPAYKLKRAHIDEHWTEEYKAVVQAEADAWNEQEQERATALATPENHRAVLWIQEFYPEYRPEPALIAHPPSFSFSQADWWTREAERPTPREEL
jgi:hypothetical protein